MKTNKVTYDGNKQETYSLFLDGKTVAELLVDEDGVIEMTKEINTFLKENVKLTSETVVIQNDGDKLGVIVDVYVGDEWETGITLWFDDYVN